MNGKMVFSTELEKVEMEIALMKRLRHPNLVALVDVIDDEEQDQYCLLSRFYEQNLHGYRVRGKWANYVF